MDEETGKEEAKTEDSGRRKIRWGGYDAANAARAGHGDVAKWLYEETQSGARADEETMKAAVGSGDIELVKWLKEKLDLWPAEGVQEAAANGHFVMLKWMHENGHYDDEVSVGTLLKAAEKGHVDIVRWIVETDSNDSDNDSYDSDGNDDGYVFGKIFHITSVGGEASLAIHSAAMNGHVEIAKYVYGRVATPKNEKEASRERRRLHRTLKLISRQLDMFDAEQVSIDTIRSAAQIGHLEVVKWLYSEFAVKRGRKMFWLYDEEDDMYFSVMDAAAGGGHLEVVRNLHEMTNGSTVEVKTRENRNNGGSDNESMDSAEWMSDDSWAEEPTQPGCTTIAMDDAAANGHLDVVRWLQQNRTEGCTKDALDFAAKNGHLEVVKWLNETRNEGCTVKAMDEASKGGHLEVVKWLAEHRSEGCTSRAMDGAAGSGALDVVKWLKRNRSDGCTPAAIIKAARNGHLRVLRWLHDNNTNGWSTAAMNNAALGGKFEALLILHRVRSEGCSPGPAHRKSPSRDIQKWLVEHYPNVESDEDEGENW